MNSERPSVLPDLTGTVDDRIAQLSELDRAGEATSAPWLRRQLDAALESWAATETKVDIESEAHTDY